MVIAHSMRTAVIGGVDGVVGVRDLRIRWIGHTLRAEADITVDPGLTVGQAHDIADHVEAHLIAGARRLTAATIQVTPLGAHPTRAHPGIAEAPPNDGSSVS